MGLPPSRDLLHVFFFGMESPATAPIYAVPSRGRCSYKQGQWRLGTSKQHPYETDVHIPFFARGPGIAPGTRVSALGSNVDIGPTFLDIAGLPANPLHDGASLLPLLTAAPGAARA
jgi:hypothetical protein